MKILITSIDGNGSGTFVSESADKPVAGSYYFLDDATNGTEAQNRLFHSLVTEYYKSDCHPRLAGEDFGKLKNWIKIHLGAGFEKYFYTVIENEKPAIYEVNHRHEIPREVMADPDYRKMVRARLKSWGDYTNSQRRHTIDKLIKDMLANGVASKKFDEILKGIKYDGS